MKRRELLRHAVSATFGGMVRAAGQTADRYATRHKYGNLVLGPSRVEGEFDSRAVDCPFVFHHSGRFYMTYIGFDGTGYQTGLASSDDLVNWKRLGCILKRDHKSEITRYNVAMNWIVRENGLHTRGELMRINGRFLGAYHAYPGAGYEQGPAVIGLCWSEDLLHWNLDPPFLHPGDGAAWERGGLYKPCLLKIDDTFYLFYNAKTDAPKSWREQIGVAQSKDLKTWRRYEGNPIIPNGGAGSADERFASDPCVLHDRGAWVFFYYGLDAKGKARDLVADGRPLLHPRKIKEILIDAGAPGSVDETYAHKPSVIWNDGALYHFYCAVAGRAASEVRGIAVARSTPWE